METASGSATTIDRRGISIVVAVVALTVLGIFVFAFATYSRNELALMRRALEQKQAEYLASSGLEWARSQLQKRRWYAAQNRYWGVHRELDPFGPNTGRLEVVCEDMRYPEVRHYPSYDALMLSHVNVYSRGSSGSRAVLIYGRYLMSPMPWLRSDSTDGAPEASEAASPGEDALGDKGVDVPRVPFLEGFLGAQVAGLQVAVGQSVAINQPVAQVQLEQLPQVTQMTAPCSGRVKSIAVRVGDKVPGGALLLTIQPNDPSAAPAPFTLKQMVRITELTAPELAEADITTPAGRETIRAVIASQSNDFVANHLRLGAAAETLGSQTPGPLAERVTGGQLLGLLPSLGASTATSTEAGNTFIRDRFLDFVWPCTPAADRQRALAGINFVLDLQPPKANPLVRQLFAALNVPYNTASPPPVKTVTGAQNLLDVTRAGLDDPDYVNQAGLYRKAQWSHDLSWTGRFNVGPNGFDPAILGPGLKFGDVFYQNIVPTQTAYDRPYVLYTDPGGTGKSVKVGHVLNFYRMFFTEAGAVAPTEEIRLDIDLIDRVINPPPGPTPAGGRAGDFQ